MKKAPRHFSLPAAYLQQVMAQVRELGTDVGLWLGRAGLTEQSLAQTADELPFDTFSRLVVDALELTQESALGLFVGQRLEAQMHGVLGAAALSSGSLRQALGLLEAFIRTRISVIGLSLEVGGKEVRVRIEETVPLGPLQRPVLEAVIMAVKKLLDATSLGTCRFSGVAFTFSKPPHARLARQLFGCDVRYGARWSGLTFQREVLDVPLRAVDPRALSEAVKICQRELERTRSDFTFAGRVRRLLLEHPNGFPSQDVAARLLQLTPRTLHRRLVAERTSFRAELEAVRHTLALEHLKVGHFKLEELAYTLGYTDFANFRRAFKRWEGVPPSVFRLDRSAKGRGRTR